MTDKLNKYCVAIVINSDKGEEIFMQSENRGKKISVFREEGSKEAVIDIELLCKEIELQSIIKTCLSILTEYGISNSSIKCLSVSLVEDNILH